jgi:lysophospholipase
MMGSSASAVNAWVIEDLTNGTLGTFAKRQIAKRQDNIVPLSELDPILDILNSSYGEPGSLAAYASWPNPFKGLDSTTPELRNESYLKIIDGSLNGQTIPMWSLIQPARALDFIFSWDDSQNARPQSWNNGSNLYNVYLAAKREGISL